MFGDAEMKYAFELAVGPKAQQKSKDCSRQREGKVTEHKAEREEART